MKEDQEVEDYDYGFSFEDADKQTDISTVEELKDFKRRLDSLYNAIIPFLDNLCKNPEKSTIFWPNRVEKIQLYKRKLEQIVEGQSE